LVLTTNAEERKTMISSLRSFMFLLAILPAGGCSSTLYVTVDGQGDSLSYREFNGEIAGERVNLFLKGNVGMPVKNLRISPDSCVWLNPMTGQIRNSRLENVRQIVYTDNSRGTWEGAGIGALAGAAFVTTVIALSDDRGEHRLKSAALMIAPVAGGLLGGVAGAVIGGISGHDRTYTIAPYAGGMDAVYLKGGTRIIGKIIEIVPQKHVVMQAWDGGRHVIDQELVERIDR
jgi:hypothetical protein